MNLAFVCGCASPGRDGVGDFTLALATACAAAGHDCSVLALADPLAGPGDAAPVGLSSRLRVVRAPAVSPAAARFEAAARLLATAPPDVLSLQFVPWAWHHRGIPLALPGLLGRLPGSSREIMFHELWLGLEYGARARHRVLGALQRFATLRLLRRWRPHTVHTHAGPYLDTLRLHGWNALQLPLSGHMPAAPPDGGATLDALLRARGITRGPEHLVAVVFGTIHAEWDGPELARRLHAAAAAAGRHLLVLVIGRSGAGGTRLASALASARTGGPTVASLGELPADDLSRVLHAADCALATSPLALLGKSATAASFLDHGLPVLLSRDDWRLRTGPRQQLPPPAPPGVLASPPGTPIALHALLAARRPPVTGGPASLAATFLSHVGRPHGRATGN